MKMMAILKFLRRHIVLSLLFAIQALIDVCFVLQMYDFSLTTIDPHEKRQLSSAMGVELQVKRYKKEYSQFFPVRKVACEYWVFSTEAQILLDDTWRLCEWDFEHEYARRLIKEAFPDENVQNRGILYLKAGKKKNFWDYYLLCLDGSNYYMIRFYW